MYHTVIPIQNLRLDLEHPVPFGDGFMLGPMPRWVLADSILKDLNKWDQQRVASAQLAFTATYEAHALGDPDPDWRGQQPRAIQDAKHEAGAMANLALWLAKPSGASFTVVIHGPEHSSGPLAQRASTHSPLLCHPRHDRASVTAADIDLAAELHNGLVDIIKNRRDGGLWTAARALWAGLQMNIPPVRCALLWVALEALFGPEDGREVTYRLSQRLGLFLGRDRAEARTLFASAKRGYAFRSKIVHGNWSKQSEGDDRILEAEQFVQQALLRMLPDGDLVRTFSGRKRESYLDDLVFTNGAA